MKKILFSLMAIAAITLTGCNKENKNEPDAPENGKIPPIIHATPTITVTCSCGNEYTASILGVDMATAATAFSMGSRGGSTAGTYKAYDSGMSTMWHVTASSNYQNYPFAAYEKGNSDDYCFWRCECGRYHKVEVQNTAHTEIPNGQQPSDWNQFNYLWE